MAQMSVKQPDDITVCPLCEQLLTDPDVLPCFHAYCSSCLDDWYRERGHASDRGGHCPLCNTAYLCFPPRESVELLKNRFVIKLLDLKRILGTDDASCVLCLSDKIRDNGVAVHRYVGPAGLEMGSGNFNEMFEMFSMAVLRSLNEISSSENIVVYLLAYNYSSRLHYGFCSSVRPSVCLWASIRVSYPLRKQNT